MVERYVRDVEAAGSIPVTSTSDEPLNLISRPAFVGREISLQRSVDILVVYSEYIRVKSFLLQSL